VSSELERLLRDARKALPEPDADTTRRARIRALAAIRRRKRRMGAAALIGTALVVVLALGASLGSVTAPNVTAAQGPSGFGFVPEPGWFALQSGGPIGRGLPAVAIAANVPFARDDDVRGLAETSGLPYSTLLGLPPEGVVIVASVVSPVRPAVPFGESYPERELPLRVRDAVPYIQYGTQVRPEQPLGQYQLRALVRGYNVDLTFYFGTPSPSSAQFAEAQDQLDRLLVGSKPLTEETPATVISGGSPTLSVIDRTYSCTTVLIGGLYQVRSQAQLGQRVGSGWVNLAYAAAGTGSQAGSRTGLLDFAPASSLAWVTAGAPSETTTAGDEFQRFPVSAGGTLGVNRSLCKPSSARVALTTVRLLRRTLESGSETFDCDAPRRVLVRFRATVRASGSLRGRARIFLATSAPVRDAMLAVRTPAGKLLSYADVTESGKARLFTARTCVPD